MTAREVASERGAIAELVRLGKSFRGIPALRDVDLALRAGEVHAWVGENGAGKSTLARVLAGLHPDYSGEIRIAGRPVRLASPAVATARGIALVQQEPQLVPELSVCENICLGREPRSRVLRLLERGVMRRRAAALLAGLGSALDPDARVAGLAPGARQLVEIAKGLAAEPRLLLFDEPSASLSQREVADLLARVRALRARGTGVVYVSHRLDEVFALADRISVLRDGALVASAPRGDWDEASLLHAMVGRALAPRRDRARAGPAAPLLRVSGLGRRGAFEDLHFELRRGEILGLAGLAGAGRSSILRSLFGLAPAERGSLAIDGAPARIARPGDALRHGISFVPEDRQREGLIPELSARENIALLGRAGAPRRAWIDAPRERAEVAAVAARVGLPPELGERQVRRLSGGNQQKVLLARALLQQPRLILLDEPTHAIDVAAKAEIHARILELAAAGTAVLLASSELPELLALCDRILVLRAGGVVAELAGDRADERALLAAASGSALARAAS